MKLETNQDCIQLAHGSGGKKTHELIRQLLLAYFRDPYLKPLRDAAILPAFGGKAEKEKLVFTTDSFVVKPIEFEGGDIGSLAVHGTVNDLAVMGARPLYLSIGLIVEEGFSMNALEKIVRSMADAAAQAHVRIVTGDFKVVEKGACDQIFINTSGIGVLSKSADWSGRSIEVGDGVLINGSIGDHGFSVLKARGAFQFEASLPTDSAPLADLVQTVLRESPGIKWMRDPTRGGLATSLNEMVEYQPFGLELDEASLVLRPAVRAFSELIGIDPLYVANEGKVLVVAAEKEVPRVLKAMQAHPLGRESAVIGRVVADPRGRVVLKTKAGGSRIVDMLVGDQLPRIC